MIPTTGCRRLPRIVLTAVAVLVLATFVTVRSAVAAGAAGDSKPTQTESAESHGKYLVELGGCNDCHTPGWSQSGGKIPTSRWLTGNKVGFRGPWGTSYPANLRLCVRHMSQKQWAAMFRTRTKYPPMPWSDLRKLHKRDLKDMYAFIKSLGPRGEAAPAWVPPGRKPRTPYILFVPQNPGKDSDTRAEDIRTSGNQRNSGKEEPR